MNRIAEEKKTKEYPLLMFTHIPLHKPHGMCVDSPEVNRDWRGNVVSQNMLSEESSEWILNEIKPQFIFTGHDHEGCIYKHNENTTE
jgi:hypothetical protein